MTLTSATFFGTPSLKPVNENKANMRWGTTDEQLLHHSHRKKPTRRGENKPQTASLISMHVLRFAQLHSDWSLHNKPVTMKQNCSRKVRETSLLPPLKKEKKRKAKTFILVSFRLISVYFGVIPARSGTFRFHSRPFPFIPASFFLVPVYSGLFRYIPFRSILFLCLVTPDCSPVCYIGD